MNLIQRREAYRAVKERYNLRAAQRDALDATANLTEILQAAHSDQWRTVQALLSNAGIFEINVDLPVYPA